MTARVVTAAALVAAAVAFSAASGCVRAKITVWTEPRPAPSRWSPAADARWSWRLSAAAAEHAEHDPGSAGDIVVLDAFTTGAQTVARLRAQGRRTLCRLGAGVWEPARPDAGRFDATVVGAATGDPDGTRWLDVRRWDALAPIVSSRLDLCQGKGFDAVVVDHLDGYAHITGFGIGLDDQLRFNTGLVTLARAKHLLIGAVEPPDRDDFDFSVAAPT